MFINFCMTIALNILLIYCQGFEALSIYLFIYLPNNDTFVFLRAF